VPLSGILTDRYGRVIVYRGFAIFQLLIAFPVWWVLSLGNVVAIIIVISIALAVGTWGMFGAQGALLPELFGASHRYIGVSVAREVSAVISGGIAPLIGSAIIAWVISVNGGNKDAGVWAWIPIAAYLALLTLGTIATTFFTPEPSSFPLSCRGQRSTTAMFPSSWRSPAAVVRLFSRSISSTRSAAVFSSTRATRLVPGIGAMSSAGARLPDRGSRGSIQSAARAGAETEKRETSPISLCTKPKDRTALSTHLGLLRIAPSEPCQVNPKRSRWVVSRKAVPIFQDKRRVVHIAKGIQANIRKVSSFGDVAEPELSTGEAELRVAVILSILENLSSPESIAELKARSPDPQTSSPKRGAHYATKRPGFPSSQEGKASTIHLRLKVENGHRSTIMSGCEANNPSAGSLCLFTNIFAKNVVRVSPSQ
jgi:hypothetical protein